LDITIEWQKPLQLSENNEPLFDQDTIPAEVLDQAGVYFFARWFGEARVPLYIGQSLTLRVRLRQHLQRTDIADIIHGRNLKNFDVQKGQKYFHYGYFRPKPRQRAKICINIVEKEMIRQALQAGVSLINEVGTAPIPTNKIFFVGSPDRLSIFPSQTEIEDKRK
jgi:hypothetical protein